MKYLILVLSLLSVEAKADWLCTEEASQRKGSDIYACGVSLGKTEDEARSNAFIAAQNEFNRLCESSESCLNHESIIDPRRTECGPAKDGFKCTRLLVFTETKHSRSVPDSHRKAMIEAGRQKKIIKGESARQLIEDYGYPGSVLTLDKDENGYTPLAYYYYNAPFCQSSTCRLTVSGGSYKILVQYDNIKPQYMDDSELVGSNN